MSITEGGGGVKMLSVTERKRFQRNDKVIREGLSKVFDVAHAMWEVKSQEQYREEYPTWDAYCESLGMTRQRGYQLTAWIEVDAQMSTRVDTEGLSERHARVLAPHDPDVRVQAWEEGTADGGVPSPEELAERANAINEEILRDEPARQVRKAPTPKDVANAICKHCDKAAEHLRTAREKQLRRVQDARAAEMMEAKLRQVEDLIEDVKTLARSTEGE